MSAPTFNQRSVHPSNGPEALGEASELLKIGARSSMSQEKKKKVCLCEL